MKLPLFYQLTHLTQFLFGNQKEKAEVKEIWNREQYLCAFKRAIKTKDNLAIESYLKVLISEKWDKGFLGVNLLDDVIFKQDESIVRLVMEKMNLSLKEELMTKGFIKNFLSCVTFLPAVGGDLENVHSYHPMNPKVTQLVLQEILECNPTLIKMDWLNKAQNKIEEVIHQKNYLHVEGLMTYDNQNLAVIVSIKASLNEKINNLLAKEEKVITTDVKSPLTVQTITAFKIDNRLNQDETKKIHSILNHLSDLSALTLSIEQQHDINSIFTEHLPELISEYAPIPGQIKEQTQAGETFNTSLDKIYQHLDTIYHQAFDSNIAKIQAKSQFFDNKKMSNSL